MSQFHVCSSCYFQGSFEPRCIKMLESDSSHIFMVHFKIDLGKG